MKRRLFNLLTLISLALCLAWAALRVRSYISDGGGWSWQFADTRYHVGMCWDVYEAEKIVNPRARNAIMH